MNKDLDDRLIPNGEYRDAQNVSVGKSESDDIGALEIVLGNIELTATNLSTSDNADNMKVIGYIADENSGKVFVFATNYNDTNGPGYISQPQFINGATKRCIIYSWDANNTGSIQILLDNIFLNFSISNPIQASIIEDLLFFTDNRNQPRKINVISALTSGYYTNESQISVAKYNPYQVIDLVKKIETRAVSSGPNPLDSTDTTTFATTASPNIQGDQLTMGRSDAWNAYGAGAIKIQFLDGTTVATDGVSDAFLNAAPGTTTIPPVGQTVQTYQANINVTIPTNTQFKFVAPPNFFTQIVVEDATGIEVGMQMVSTGADAIAKVVGGEFVLVTNITGNTITVNSDIVGWVGVTNLIAGDYLYFLISTMTDKSAVTGWPGDPDYLEDRYVRFSYRFQYDDGEYSLMAPFTQIAYVPKQKGYFLGSGITAPATVATPDDENAAFRSTIVQWMENNVNNVELLLPLPEVFSGEVTPIYKIRSLDILYKESDALVTKVLETLTVPQIQNGSNNTNIFTYNYQSRKPYKTLTEEQTVRVYDKVPVRALVQETAGSRVIYGNYTDRYTPPGDLNYEVRVFDKNTTLFDNWIEYPNHTLKQNRNYQVGFILSDKYGRQSPVVLSPVTTTTTSLGFLGSTIYSPYNNDLKNLKTWFGNALQVIVNSRIPGGFSTQTQDPYNPDFATGTPGLYAIRTGDKNGFNVFNTTTPPSFNTDFTQYTFTITPISGATLPALPTVGTYLRGKYVDFVKVTGVSNSVVTTGQTSQWQQGGTFMDLIAQPVPPLEVGMVVSTDATGETGIYDPLGFPVTIASLNPTGTIEASMSDPVKYYGPPSFTSKTLTFTKAGGNDYTITCDGAIDDSIYGEIAGTSANNPDLKYAYTLNETGWYSYKVVVKQTEQDYYNVYLPGILNGYPSLPTPIPEATVPFPTDEVNKTANIVLINDNINKVPRDLSEVGPDQKQFRSSVQLFGRVSNNTSASNVQFFPGTSAHTAISISTSEDAGMIYSQLKPSSTGPVVIGGQANLYQIETKPLIARLATTPSNGIVPINIGAITSSMEPYLAIYETEPTESLLDIYWETATEGLIADLNADVDTGFVGATSFTADGYAQNESFSSGEWVTNWFWPVTNEGVAFKQTSSYSFINALPAVDTVGEISQVNSVGGSAWGVEAITPVLNSPGTKFILVQNNESTSTNRYGYRIKVTFTQADAFIYKFGSDQGDQYTFSFPGLQTVVSPADPLPSPGLSLTGALTNIDPDFSVTPIVADVTDGVSALDPFITYVGVNGSSNTVKTKDLYWSIVSITPNAGFSIDDQTGALYQTNGESSVNYGTYTIKIKLRDATNESQVEDTGFGFVERDQVITIGPAKANNTIKSLCRVDPIPYGTVSGQAFPQTTAPVGYRNQFTAPKSGDNSYYNRPAPSSGVAVSGIWYLAAATYNNYDTGVGGDFEGITIVGAIATENGGNSNPYLAGDPWRLGGALTKGTLVLTCNLSLNNADSNAFGGAGYADNLKGAAQFRVYHRTSATDTWAQIKDINNNLQAYVPSDRGDGSSSLPYVIETRRLFNSVATSYAQVVFSFDQLGEYAVLLDEAETVVGDTNENRMAAWCNSNDLHYSECVIEGGSQITLGNATNEYTYAYEYGTSTVSTASAGCSAGTNQVYSLIPYGEYVTQFFSNQGLTTPFTEIPAGSGTNIANYDNASPWYAFKPKGSSPYYESGVSSIFTFSTRFTQVDGKKWPTTPQVAPNEGCYAEYCNRISTGSFQPSCNPVIRLFPYGLVV